MSNVSAEGSSELSAFDLRDEIYKKLAQANGECNPRWPGLSCHG